MPDEIREYRGTLTQPGKESPYRNRTAEENLSLFERMRAGEFDEGTHVLRAKIDMNSPNVTMRDPIMYRIKKVSHYRTGDAWCIYPMYDFAHCLSDSIEGITHSICTLEFENNRPLYDWFLEALNVDTATAADRVCPSQPQLHGPEQAEAHRAGRKRGGQRLGRSADAHPLRHAQERVHSRSDPQLL